MDHHAAVQVRVARGIRHFHAGEPVFQPQEVVRVGEIGEEMPIFGIELRIPVIADFQNFVLHPEGVRIVLPERPLGNFYGPAAEVGAVEEGDPAFC